MPTKKNTPAPSTLNSPRGMGPAREPPTATNSPNPCVTTAPTPTPQPLPATGQGRVPPARRGTAWGTRTTHADNATRSTFNTATTSNTAQQHERNGVRAAAAKQAGNNDVEHNTH